MLPSVACSSIAAFDYPIDLHKFCLQSLLSQLSLYIRLVYIRLYILQSCGRRRMLACQGV